MKNKHRLVWLDLVRGLSAMVVCASHLRAATLLDYSDLNAPNLFHKLFYFSTGLGHQAVIVFFVLSGFFVGGSVLKRGKKFQLLDYCIARLSRLWIVLIPALLVTGLINILIAIYSPEVLNGFYYETWNSGPKSGFYSASLQTFLGNIIFLQTILVPVFGINGPLWSLAYEFWYYILFPLLAFSAGKLREGNIASRILSAATAIIIYFYLSNLRSGFLIWIMGVVVYLFVTKLPIKPRSIALVFTLICFITSLVYSMSNTLQSIFNIPTDIVTGIGFSIFCIVIATFPISSNIKFSKFINTISNTLSESSYSLYLIHFPFIIMIATFAYQGEKVAPNQLGILIFFIEYVLLLGLGWIFWFLFERHTQVVREWVLSYINRSATS